MNSMPRRFRTAKLQPSLVRTNQHTWVDAALPDLSRIFLHQWNSGSKQRIVLGIGCQRKCHRTTLQLVQTEQLSRSSPLGLERTR